MKKKINCTRGFTLIELLVVISIIALLSSVILASLSNVRGKANIAAGQTFDDYNYHAFGSTAVGVWSLNEATPGPWLDTSGNNDSLTLSSGGSVTSVPGIFGNALQFNNNPGSSYIYSVNPINLGSVWTISAWVNNYSSTYDTGGFAGFLAFTMNYFMYFHNGGYFGIYWPCSGGTGQCSLNEQAGVRSFNTWYQVTATHDNTTTILYVNGVQVAKDINDNSLPLSTGSVYVGNIPTSITIWSLDGAVNNVRLYTQSLTVNDVQQLYAEGLSQHQSLADK